MSCSATGLDEPTAAPAALASFSISFMFSFEPTPLPALTTLSASIIGVSISIPTEKSYPSALRASARAVAFSAGDPSLKIIFFLAPVTGNFFTAVFAAGAALAALPNMWDAITTFCISLVPS